MVSAGYAASARSAASSFLCFWPQGERSGACQRRACRLWPCWIPMNRASSDSILCRSLAERLPGLPSEAECSVEGQALYPVLIAEVSCREADRPLWMVLLPVYRKAAGTDIAGGFHFDRHRSGGVVLNHEVDLGGSAACPITWYEAASYQALGNIVFGQRSDIGQPACLFIEQHCRRNLHHGAEQSCIGHIYLE